VRDRAAQGNLTVGALEETRKFLRELRDNRQALFAEPA
jgi:hypothetical protein